MGIPEPFEMGTTPLLHSEPNHDEKNDGHDPTGNARASGEISGEEVAYAFASGCSFHVKECETPEVDHVCDDMNDGASYNGPSRSLVKCDAFVKRNEAIEGSSTEERNEISADREKDEDDIDMENESGGTGEG